MTHLRSRKLRCELSRFSRRRGQLPKVETVGFDYGQRHRVELECRADFRGQVVDINPAWAGRLGPDHMLDLSVLGQVSETALTRDAEIAYASAARAVRRLIEQHGVAALVALLEDLARGAPFATAFHQRIAMRYEDFAASVAQD